MKKIILGFIALYTFSFGQVTVLDSTSTFTQPVLPNGSVMVDTIGDQQTGQGADDFIVNGFYFKYGTINGVQNQIVRVYLDKFNTKGFGGNLRIGVDANGDGSVDIFYGVSDTGSSPGIYFQNPTSTGTNVNVSPSTTSLGSNYSLIAFNSNNYNYVASNTDAELTFALSFTSLQSNLAALGINITVDTYLRFIAFTSTQSNSINQDLYGTVGINNTQRFDSGVFTDYYNFSGQRVIVPEPSMYGSILLGALLPAVVWLKRRKS